MYIKVILFIKQQRFWELPNTDRQQIEKATRRKGNLGKSSLNRSQGCEGIQILPSQTCHSQTRF